MSFLDDYEPVEDRIRSFWQDNPAGRIHTHLVKHEAGEYIVHAMVFRDFQSRDADATGYAHEDVASLPGNMKASALEVCETSAIGRALANLGYAAKGKRPSREEMQKTSGAVREFGEGSQSAPESTSAPRDKGAVSAAEGSGSGKPGRVGAGETSKAAEGRPLDEAGLSSGSDGGLELPAPHRCDFVDWPEKPGGWERCNFPGCNAKQKKRAA